MGVPAAMVQRENKSACPGGDGIGAGPWWRGVVCGVSLGAHYRFLFTNSYLLLAPSLAHLPILSSLLLPDFLQIMRLVSKLALKAKVRVVPRGG